MLDQEHLYIDIETEVYPELGHRENRESNQAVRDFLKRIDEKEKQHEKGCTYEQVRETLKKILSVPELQGKLIISGGIVPYIISDTDSGRLHSDIDVICKQEDMTIVREKLKECGVYNERLDSLLYPHSDSLDYGVDTNISGVPVGFYPYEVKTVKRLDGSKLVDTDMIVQRTFTTPYEKNGKPEFKVKEIPNLQEKDYYSESEIDGIPFKHTSLELIRATKVLALKAGWRTEKDLKDIAQIDAIGIDKEKQKRVDIAVKNMYSTLDKRSSGDEQGNSQTNQNQQAIDR